MRRRKMPTLLVLLVALSAAAGAVRADTARLSASRDNMILGNHETYANGAGQSFCVGRTGEPGTRRALIAFDIAGSVPAGSTIDSVTLELYESGAAFMAGTNTMDLHRVLSDWGEGGSNASAGECRGASGQFNDATWRYTFYDPGDVPGSPQWTTLGADFAASPSATTTLDTTIGPRTWSSAQMINDVQAWLDSPSTNYGWLLKRTSELGESTSIRFSSRQHADANQQPKLFITYTPPSATGACCFAGQSCQILSASSCASMGGNFQGPGTVCSPNPCPPEPTGACCANDGSCSEISELQCNALDGTYQGDGLLCSNIECPVVLEPFVDPLPIPAVAQPTSGTVGGVATYQIAIREIQQQLHRDLPPTTVWGYGDGPTGASFPGPTIEATANLPVTVDWINDLRDTSAPGDPKPLRVDHYLAVDGLGPPPACMIHGAQDLPKIVTHLHGAHVEAQYDGYPEYTYLPGNQDTYVYSNKQLPATLWYHDHALGITRLNVYMGLAGGYLIRDAAYKKRGDDWL